jgi:conjugal transfer ATP-binding protein TraC
MEVKNPMFKVNWFSKRKQRKSASDNEQGSFQIKKGLSDHEAEMIAPPSIIEKIPGEKQANDYWVEIGDNIGGARYLKSWFMKFTGRTTWVGMLDPILLAEGDGSVDLTISVEPVEPNIIMSRLAHRIAILQAELYNETNPAKQGAMMQELQDLQGQMGRLRVNAEKLFKSSVIMNVSANTPELLRRISKTIIKRMGAIGVKFLSADTRQLETWRHSIGIGDKSIAKDTYIEMESSNIADFFIYGYGGLSHRQGVLLGFDQYNRPVFYDGWDRRLANQHMVVFGRTGSGKSFSIKILTRRSAALGIRTGIVDPDREYKNLVLAMGGAYAELSPKENNHHRINIYDVEEEEDDQGRVVVNIEEASKAVQAVLFKMIRTVDPSLLTGKVKVAIHDTVNQLYSDFRITSNPESLYEVVDGQWVKKQMPTLYDHYRLMVEHPDLQSIHPVIKLFTREGGDSSKAIFDGHSTFSIGDAPVFGISVADLDEEWMKPIGIFVATKWIWERFAKKNRAIQKRIIVDEAQLMMENPEEAKWLENAYRRGRKLNVSMCAVTQGFEVFLKVPEGMGILKNAPTKLLLRQESIDIEAVQGRFDLAEGEARFLLTATSGVGILKVDEESTIVRMHATDNEYWLYTTNPNDFADVA